MARKEMTAREQQRFTNALRDALGLGPLFLKEHRQQLAVPTRFHADAWGHLVDSDGWLGSHALGAGNNRTSKRGP